MTDFYNTADTDKDGYLTKQEVKSAFSANGQTLSDTELDTAVSKADTDADGKLTLDELKRFMVPVVQETETPSPDPETPKDPANPQPETPNDPKPEEPVTPPV